MSGPWEKYAAPDAGPWTRFATPPAAGPDPTEGMSTTEKAVAGFGQGVTAAGRAIAQGVSKLIGAESVGAGLVDQATIDDAKRLDAPLLATAPGKVGSVVGSAVPAALAAAVPGANTMLGATLLGAGTGALTTDGDLAERAKGAVLGAAGGVAGKVVGDTIGKAASAFAANRAAAATAKQAANAGRDAAVTAAKDAGYVVTPSQAGAGGVVNAATQMLTGKVKLQQAASVKNRDVVNAAAARALGLAEDTPLTPAALKTVRDQAGRAYEALRGVGTVTADAPYAAALDGIAARYGQAAEAFPGLARPEIQSLVESMKQPSFEAGAAVDALKILRESADDAFRSGNTGFARANREAADAVEGVLERHLQSIGRPDVLQQFRAARELIARAHTVAKAASPAGDVSALALAQQLKRGKPLSGDLRGAADAAAAFPKAFQQGVDVPPVSKLSMLASMLGMATGNAPVAAVAAAGAPARSIALSPVYQSLFVKPPSYGPGLAARAAPALDSDAVRALFRAGGAQGALEYGR